MPARSGRRQFAPRSIGRLRHCRPPLRHLNRTITEAHRLPSPNHSTGLTRTPTCDAVIEALYEPPRGVRVCAVRAEPFNRRALQRKERPHQRRGGLEWQQLSLRRHSQNRGKLLEEHCDRRVVSSECGHADAQWQSAVDNATTPGIESRVQTTAAPEYSQACRGRATASHRTFPLSGKAA